MILVLPSVVFSGPSAVNDLKERDEQRTES